MIGLLFGRVIQEEPSGGLLLDVQGVGYELSCPLGTRERARTTSEGLLTVHVHTSLRQDALELFGFPSLEERTVFRQLIQVPNVGPRTALHILSALPAADLALIVNQEDQARLSKIPGIGKKTAERLILELRGKLQASSSESPVPSSVPSPPAHKLIAALVGLGYKPSEAEKAAQSLPAQAFNQDLGTLLRQALQFLTS